MAGGEGAKESRKRKREVSRKVREMKIAAASQTPRRDSGEVPGDSSRPSRQPVSEVEVAPSPPRQEEPPPPPVPSSAEGGPSQPTVRTLSRGAQVLIHSLERNRSVRENPGLAKVLGASICLQEDRNRLIPSSIDDLLAQTMSLSVESLVNQHIIREKARLLRQEILKAVQDAASAQAQLSSAHDYIAEIEGRMKSYEDKLADQARELGEARALRTADVARLTEEIRAKEEEAVTREAGAYVNAHSDLLAELKRRYPGEDFSWMVDLAPQDEEESEEKTERERERLSEMSMYLENRLGVTLQPNDL
ncbi:uncharacterized protein LOC110637602 [Hevea brasiliensis]|uniref:uncharacterized protein LOC110637602 n=1 Tax=Hevea brasiliensis TaxID=3981 RepID=UPI0025CC45CB|nr:uncharacterized protein LOC110637602 [Hevea brasiliensis]XP_058004104.1 uncharacterized protein LOC110637602 [Hevea brasiliensis]XP_058004105.1 uncharacterized protein LOC110637602 [Hevea brasiliensis]